MEYTYYPGCSLESSARGYDESMQFVFRTLGHGLHEIEDWNCCGATSYMATGFKTANSNALIPYGYGTYEEVYTSLEFERIVSSTGPTQGEIVMKNGEKPRAIGIIHCVGSRDINSNAYCSRVCCMYALKFAHLIVDRTEAEVYEFYIDMRAFGKGYEEFYSRILANISKGEIEVEPIQADIDPDLCSGCRVCNDLCPYGAISFDEDAYISKVNSALCKACGTCVASCPCSAASAQHFTDKQIFAEIEGILK